MRSAGTPVAPPLLPESALWRLVFVLAVVTSAGGIGLLTARAGRAPTDIVLSGSFGAVLIGLAWCDVERRVIPNRIVYPALLAALALAGAWSDRGLLDAIAGGLSAFVALAVVALLSRGGLGGGDVKMGTLVGAVVGYPAVLTAGAVMALTGGLAALLLFAVGRAARTLFLAYGPFLAMGGLVASF